MTVTNQLGFGCVGLTTLPTQGSVLRLLHTVLDAGVTYFDTAPVYGRGYSERLLGRFLREARGPVTVATKFGLGPPPSGPLPPWLALPLQALRRRGSVPAPPAMGSGTAALLAPRRITRRQVEAAFDRSRRALGRERLDCYLLHEGLPAFLDGDAWDFLQTQRSTGTIGALGLAAGGRNYPQLTPGQLAGWDVLQYEFGPAWPENQALPGRFPGQRHVFHSCLRDHGRFGPPGRILAGCLRANPPGGRVLFSTRKPAHLHANLRALAGA